MQPERPPEIQLGLAIALQPAKDRPTKNQKFGLIGRSAKSVREHFHRLDWLFQTVEQTGEMQTGLDVLWLQLE
jgi:hypothetical protein